MPSTMSTNARRGPASGMFLIALTLLLVFSHLHDASAAFPGKNGNLLVSRSTYRGDPYRQLGLLNPFSLKFKVISPPADAYISQASFMPDGREIIPWRDSVSPDGKAALYVLYDISCDSRECENPTPYALNGIHILPGSRQSGQLQGLDADVYPISAAFSPDGRHIAFVSADAPANVAGTTSSIWVTGRDGTGTRLVKRLATRAENISYSPDGRTLAFNSSQFNIKGSRTDIHTVKLNGSGLKRLTRGGVSRRPVFSPDGQWIAYEQADQTTWWRVALLATTPDGRSSRNLIADPDAGFKLLDWGRAAPFVYKGFSKRKSQVRIRVFGPGRVTVSGGAIARRSRISTGTELLKVPVAVKRGVRIAPGRKLRVKISFSPRGGLPSATHKKVRLGGR